MNLLTEYEIIESPFKIERDYDYAAWGNSGADLMVASKGGTGHITAMMALLERYPQSAWARHKPVLYDKKPISVIGSSIFFASHLDFVRQCLQQLGVIAIPPHNVLMDAIQKMNDKEPRPYIDMLRDVSPIGYESAAIWDELQRHDRQEMLTKLITLQPENDKKYHAIIYDYFFDKLESAYRDSKPYRKIVSTQVIGLPALCDAVYAYNTRVQMHYGNTVPLVVIEQFMTDLPTQGAVHYFNTLKSLTSLQQQQMNLHAVNLTTDVLLACLGENIHFQHLYSIDPKKNPMVRAGFFQIDNSSRFTQEVILTCKDNSNIFIGEKEKIASIMLGGQAGLDTGRYITTFLQTGADKVFVFGGYNSPIKEKIDDLLKQPEYAGRIIPLLNQDAPFIAALETRSAWVVKRAGGLSVMEELAMNHHPEQIIFIHYSDTCGAELKSGISWEDHNADMLIDLLKKQNIRVIKTCPMDVSEQLQNLSGSSASQEKWDLI